jgi:Zonular occludens toxin (Zot)
MIEVIEGRGVGAGKSYTAIADVLPYWAVGGTAFMSDTMEVKWEACKALGRKRYGVHFQDSQYRAISESDLQRLHEVTMPGTADLPVRIYVDEAQGAFNARDWSDKGKRPFFSWLCQSRHDDNDVIILSQAAANIDKQIRRLLTFYWVVRNSEKTILLGWSAQTWMRLLSFGLSDGKFFLRMQLDQDGKTLLSKRWVRADREIFGCYNSKSMRLKHRRGGGEVARLKLERVKQKGLWSMGKLALAVIVVVALFAGCRLMTHGLGFMKRPAARSVSVANVSSVSPGGEEFRNGQVLREALRASCFGYVQTEKRVYRLGQRNDLGWVRALRRDRVEVERSPHVTVFVETFTDSGSVSIPEGSAKPFNPMAAVVPKVASVDH